MTVIHKINNSGFEHLWSETHHNSGYAYTKQPEMQFSSIEITADYSPVKMIRVPILAIIYNGKTYIIDGHKRLKVMTELGRDVNVTILSTEEAIKDPKWQDILKDSFKKEIGNEN